MGGKRSVGFQAAPVRSRHSCHGGHWPNAEWLISMVKEGEADTHLEITIVSG